MSVGPHKTTLRTWAGRKRVPPIPDVPKHKAKKDTRRWCRGRVGVQHEPEWRKSVRGPWSEHACRACGRIMDYCFKWHRNCICGLHDAD